MLCVGNVDRVKRRQWEIVCETKRARQSEVERLIQIITGELGFHCENKVLDIMKIDIYNRILHFTNMLIFFHI